MTRITKVLLALLALVVAITIYLYRTPLGSTSPPVHYEGEVLSTSTASPSLPPPIETWESQKVEATNTLPVPLGQLPANFAQAHVAFTDLPFVKITGSSSTTNGVTYSLEPADCDEDIVENIKLVYKYFKDSGASLRTILALILTESGFRNLHMYGTTCRVYQNTQGAPAYGIGQVYEPGGVTHPEVSLASLADIDYSVRESARIFRGHYAQANGDDVLAAACYKGFCSSDYPDPKNAAAFVSNFMTAYNSDGFSVTYKGESLWIPFDEAAFLELPIW